MVPSPVGKGKCQCPGVRVDGERDLDEKTVRPVCLGSLGALNG